MSIPSAGLAGIPLNPSVTAGIASDLLVEGTISAPCDTEMENRDWTPSELIAFEDEMARLFEAGKIKAPLHLAGGNEQQLIDIFKNVGPDDWVLTSWRSHYHCLLKGVPPAELTDKIIDGRSIALCFPKHKILSSAIVGGIMPIAVGLAWAIKRRGGNERVWCFIGDMTAFSGIAQESRRYAHNFDLPICFVCESNSFSVCTKTEDVWGTPGFFSPRFDYHAHEYLYDLSRPHVGTGKWVSF